MGGLHPFRADSSLMTCPQHPVQGKLFGRLADYFTPQPVDDCLEVLELVLLGGQATITPIMSSSSEIIQLDWQAAGDSAVCTPPLSTLFAC